MGMSKSKPASKEWDYDAPWTDERVKKVAEGHFFPSHWGNAPLILNFTTNPYAEREQWVREKGTADHAMLATTNKQALLDQWAREDQERQRNDNKITQAILAAQLRKRSDQGEK